MKLYVYATVFLSQMGCSSASRKRYASVEEMRKKSKMISIDDNIGFRGYERIMFEAAFSMSMSGSGSMSMSIPVPDSSSMSMQMSTDYEFSGSSADVASVGSSGGGYPGSNGSNDGNVKDGSSPSAGPPSKTTLAPSTSPVDATATSAPTSNPTADGPTSSPNLGQESLECVNNKLVSVNTQGGTTTVTLVVGYLVESTSNSTSDFLPELENQLFLTAVQAALDCEDPLKLDGEDMATPQILSTEITLCNPAIEESESCTLFETEILFYIRSNETDAEEATFHGYSAIESDIADGTYITEGFVPTLTRIEYLSPLPLIDPTSVRHGSSGTGEDLDSNDAPSGDKPSGGSRSAKNVSGWSIAIGVLTLGGILASFVFWSHKRHNRTTQHVSFSDSISGTSMA